MLRLRPGRVPDPLRAHGALVFLALSVVAGTLSALGGGVGPALFAGLGFSGVFLIGSGLAIGFRRGLRRLGIGLAVAVGAPLLSVWLGADPKFFAYGLLALFPAGLAAWCAERQGFQAPLPLALGVAALVVAAPSAACAGGATARTSALLLALLVPFYVWRTLVIRRLVASRSDLGGRSLRSLGQREALLSGSWTFFAVFLIHWLPA